MRWVCSDLIIEIEVHKLYLGADTIYKTLHLVYYHTCYSYNVKWGKHRSEQYYGEDK